MKFYYFLYLFFALIYVNTSQADTNQFDKDLAQFINTNVAGYSVLISQKGQVIYENTSGLANIELSVPLSSDHIFEIGSLTKQFTAVAILLLEQRGKLSIDDNIDKYIDGINSTQGIVTLRHLLSHTSGLVDPLNTKDFLASTIKEDVTLVELIKRFKNGHWQAQPGKEGFYSNIGYSMLAFVVEQVSNMRYEQFLKTQIFQALKMENTHQASFAIKSTAQQDIHLMVVYFAIMT